MESPGSYVLNKFHAAIFAWPCVLSDRPPVLCWLSPGEGWDVAARCGWDKLKMAQLLIIMAQVSSIWAKGWMFDDCVCVISLDPSLVEGESHGILLIRSLIDCLVHVFDVRDVFLHFLCSVLIVSMVNPLSLTYLWLVANGK